MAYVRDAFRNKRALSSACFGETGSSSFGVGTRHRCEVDTKRACKRTCVGSLLPSMQAPRSLRLLRLPRSYHQDLRACCHNRPRSR